MNRSNRRFVTMVRASFCLYESSLAHMTLKFTHKPVANKVVLQNDIPLLVSVRVYRTYKQSSKIKDKHFTHEDLWLCVKYNSAITYNLSSF